MRITVHNVGHGLCVSLVHENGNVMLWDCGHSESIRPSAFFREMRINRIDRFFVTNFDEDHISDLPSLRRELRISTLHKNDTISSAQLQRLKCETGPISLAMESMLDMINTYTAGPPSPPPDFPDVHFNTFCNPYGSDFHDTNNISLVTFLKCRDKSFIIPGDLEVAGWETLLNDPNFRQELADVDVFIASHHGRENGYFAEVFNICNPEVVIFSDSTLRHATQEMTNTYASHASSVNLNGERRFVLTTRNDGSIYWDI